MASVHFWVYKFVNPEDCLNCPIYVGKNVNIILFDILYYIVYLLTNSLEQSSFWGTGSQLVKKFSHFMEPKFHYSIHKCIPPVPTLSPSWQTNQFSASQENFPILWNPNSNTAFTSAYHLSLSWVLLEKLTSSQLVKKFPHFYGTQIPVQHSQVPTTCHYP
jgi:hypothetical protein